MCVWNPHSTRPPRPQRSPITRAPCTGVAAQRATAGAAARSRAKARRSCSPPVCARPMLLPRALSGEGRRYGREAHTRIELGRKTDKALETHGSSPPAAHRKRGWIGKTGQSAPRYAPKDSDNALADVLDPSCGPEHGMSEVREQAPPHTIHRSPRRTPGSRLEAMSHADSWFPHSLRASASGVASYVRPMQTAWTPAYAGVSEEWGEVASWDVHAVQKALQLPASLDGPLEGWHNNHDCPCTRLARSRAGCSAAGTRGGQMRALSD